MAGTRRSARVATSDSKPVYNEDALEARSGGGKKRARKTQSGSPPAAKRGKKAPEEKQQTLEESLDESKPAPATADDAQDAQLAEVIEKSKTEVSGPNGDQETSYVPEEPPKDTEMADAPATKIDTEQPPPEPTAIAHTSEAPVKVDDHPTRAHELSEAPVEIDGGKDLPSAENGAPEVLEATNEAPTAEPNGADASESKDEKHTGNIANGHDAVETQAHDHDTPASILEKGILYFMFRGRVGVEDPQDINDIARSFMVMRPLPHDSKLGDGPIGDDGRCRLLVLPRKTWPASGRDRFLAFVEKSKASFAELKDAFSASDYETKTAGTRHIPAMTLVGEAVYAMTTTGRESHLAYILTIPEQLSEVQKDMGLKNQGSFIISTKNPQAPSPANASIGKSPDFPEDVMESFKGLRWLPTEPKHLDYVNTQFLMIGESSGLSKATEVQPNDEKSDKDTPLQEMEKLEGEDEIRVKHLNGDDAVFVDLDMRKSEFPKVPSTW